MPEPGADARWRTVAPTALVVNVYSEREVETGALSDGDGATVARPATPRPDAGEQTLETDPRLQHLIS